MVAATATDMVGKDVTKNRSSLQLFLTPDSMNTFLNDAAQQLFNMWATPIGKKYATGRSPTHIGFRFSIPKARATSFISA